jgi:hypothetical protein
MSSIIRFHLLILLCLDEVIYQVLCLDEVICQVLFGSIYGFYYV